MEAGTLAIRAEGRIDISLIPPSAAEQLAATACEGILAYFQQPGVQEKFEKWLSMRNQQSRERKESGK